MTSRRYFAFLRAVNTGSRRLTNEEVIAPFLALGFNDVAAYQAAGNVTFRTDNQEMATADVLEPALATAYGFGTPTFVRDAEYLRRIIDREWFTPDELRRTAGKVQVTFLKAKPEPAVVEEVRSLVPDEDRVVFEDTEWLWLPVAGVSTSELPVSLIESLVGPMTMRTLGTVERLVARFPG